MILEGSIKASLLHHESYFINSKHEQWQSVAHFLNSTPYLEIHSCHSCYRTFISSKTLVCSTKWYEPSQADQLRAGAHSLLGDPASIHPFLAEIGKDRRKSVDGSTDLDTGAAALHLAVRCASGKFLSLNRMMLKLRLFQLKQ